MRYTEESLVEAVSALGWDVSNDDIHVEIGGTSVYEIEGAGTKWAPVKGTRKYNKDAFIVIKNRSLNPTVPSQPNPELKQHHAWLDWTPYLLCNCCRRIRRSTRVFFFIVFMPALQNTKGRMVGYKDHKTYGDSTIYEVNRTT